MLAAETTPSQVHELEIRVITSLCAACGVACAGEQVRTVLASLPRNLSFRDRIVRAAEASGLRVKGGRSTVVEGLRSSSRNYPSVALVSGSQSPTAVIARGMRWGRASIRLVSDSVRVMRLRPKATARLLGETRASDPVDWLYVEPAYPAGPVDAPKGRKPGERLRQLIGSERRAVSVILVYAVATGVLALATPLAIQVLITWLAFGALLQPIVVLAGLLFIVLSFAGLLRGLQRHAVEIVQRRIFVRLMTDVTQRLTRVRVKTFDKMYGPELVNRFFDVLSVQKAASSLLVDGASAALQAAVGLLILGFYHPALLVFDLVVIVVILLVLIPLGRGAQRTAIYESKRKYAAVAWVQQIARHSAAMKLNGAELAAKTSDDLAQSYLNDRAAHFTVFFRQYVGMLGVQVLVSASLLLLCGWLVLEGQLTVGQLVAAEFIVASALAGFGKVVDKLDTYYDLIAAVDKLGALADLPQERRVGLVREQRAEPLAVDVVGANIDGQALSLSVGAGAKVWVHLSSHLRTDFAETIVGLRDAEGGAVRHDGGDLRTLHPTAVYEDVALVQGDDTIIASIRDNIALGRAEVDEAKIWWALGRVRLADCVAGLPEGLDTHLGPAGRPLSPSQVTRILFARAIAGDPRLIVVDGALDDAELHTRDILIGAMASGPTAIVLSTHETGDVPGFQTTRVGAGL